MSDFLQLHLLTAYPPSNLNRDDMGRPKSAVFGGAPRLRISSQSLKRAWRASDTFQQGLAGHLGARTKRIGDVIVEHLTEQGIEPDRAVPVAREVAAVFGKLEDGNDARIKQLAFVSPAERAKALAMALKLAAGDAPEGANEKQRTRELSDAILNTDDAAVDIAMFGRMLADNSGYNREAAVQVAHALTTHRAIAEDDYYSAVDDLKKRDEADAGAGHLGVREYGAGVFYLYVCIDRGMLRKHLDGDHDLWGNSQEALLLAAATIAPSGMQASFASRARALYALVEKGPSAPRSLAAAFLKPVGGEDLGGASINALKAFRERVDQAYGDVVPSTEMDVITGTGTLSELVAFATST